MTELPPPLSLTQSPVTLANLALPLPQPHRGKYERSHSTWPKHPITLVALEGVTTPCLGHEFFGLLFFFFFFCLPLFLPRADSLLTLNVRKKRENWSSQQLCLPLLLTYSQLHFASVFLFFSLHQLMSYRLLEANQVSVHSSTCATVTEAGRRNRDRAAPMASTCCAKYFRLVTPSPITPSALHPFDPAVDLQWKWKQKLAPKTVMRAHCILLQVC